MSDCKSKKQKASNNNTPPAKVYGYIYSTLQQHVAVDADVIFDQSGIITNGIVHNLSNAGTQSQIIFNRSGDYSFHFLVYGNNPNQFALFLQRGAAPAAPITGAIYGTGASVNVGQVIASIRGGDVITLRNHTSLASILLLSPLGGTEMSVNASLLIERIGPT